MQCGYLGVFVASPLIYNTSFQDFDVRLWHIPSRQCVRTLNHKGSVCTVRFFSPLSGILDSDNFKPSITLMPFEKNVQSTTPDESYVLQVRQLISDTYKIILMKIIKLWGYNSTYIYKVIYM